MTLRAASRKKLLCHVDFPHISSIDFFTFSLFFEQIIVTAASLTKLLRHVDFPHIISIALFSVLVKSLGLGKRHSGKSVA